MSSIQKGHVKVKPDSITLHPDSEPQKLQSSIASVEGAEDVDVTEVDEEADDVVELEDPEGVVAVCEELELEELVEVIRADDVVSGLEVAEEVTVC